MKKSRNRKKTLIAGTLCALLLFLVGESIAGENRETRLFDSGIERTLLLELFTSEGCSSCPPAEKYLGTFRAHPRLWVDYVPVAFHVRIWDDLGWKDPYAADAYTQRQKKYAETWQTGRIYTPCFVVGGQEWSGYFRREALPEPEGQEIGNLRVLVRKSGTLRALFTPVEPLDEAPLLCVVPLGFQLVSEVRAGENKGRSLKHDFVALALKQEPLRKTDGISWERELTMPKSQVAGVQAQALAVWIEHPENPLVPWQAAGGWLRSDPAAGVSKRN